MLLSDCDSCGWISSIVQADLHGNSEDWRRKLHGKMMVVVAKKNSPQHLTGNTKYGLTLMSLTKTSQYVLGLDHVDDSIAIKGLVYNSCCVAGAWYM